MPQCHNEQRRDRRGPVARPGSADSSEVPAPLPSEGIAVVEGLGVGLCGNGIEIVAGDYGQAPSVKILWCSGTRTSVASSSRPEGLGGLTRTCHGIGAPAQ